jgi:hypothetical protein
MSRTEEAFQRIVGVTPAMTRPPFGKWGFLLIDIMGPYLTTYPRLGSYNSLVQQVAGARNQTLILWDFDSGDSTGSTPAQSEAAYSALADQNPPSILALNHDPIGMLRTPFNIS